MAPKRERGGLWLALAVLALLAWWAFKPQGPSAPPATPAGVPGQVPSPAATPAEAAPTPVPAGPRLAICIDDWGYVVEPVKRLQSGLRFPLTTAILPHLPQSAASAEASFAAGHEVILHCPMQSVKSIRREKETLLVGMAPEAARAALAAEWGSIPHLVGMNNHEGSAGSADRALMDVVAAFLKERHAYFLDSVTTPKSAIPAAATAAGVPWARRRVFLDNVDSVAAVTAQFRQAVAIARKTGQCIAIGHPKKNTLDALERLAPEAQAQGIVLVPVSALVHP